MAMVSSPASFLKGHLQLQLGLLFKTEKISTLCDNKQMLRYGSGFAVDVI